MWKRQKMKVIFYFLMSFYSIDAYTDFHEELFESGTFRPEDKRKNATLKYLSSSTEDLVLLFRAEKDLLREINGALHSSTSSIDAKNQELIQKYKETVDFE